MYWQLECSSQRSQLRPTWSLQMDFWVDIYCANMFQHVRTMGIIRVEADIWGSTEFAKTFERVLWGPSEQRHFKVVVQFLKRHPCNTTCADWCSKSAGLHCFSPSVIDFIWLFERAGKWGYPWVDANVVGVAAVFIRWTVLVKVLRSVRGSFSSWSCWSINMTACL